MAEQVATNITWHEGTVTPEERLNNMGQKGATFWFTGLSGSGKSTLVHSVAETLFQKECHSVFN